jgi:beta-lactamase class A
MLFGLPPASKETEMVLSSRRALIVGATGWLVACGGWTGPTRTDIAAPRRRPHGLHHALTEARNAAEAALADLEERSGGRLGVFILDTGLGQGFGWRARERFAMCSTFKMSLSALILMEIARGRLAYDQRVPLSETDLIDTHAPLARASAPAGFMTVGAMAESIQKTSDNICANLLLRLIDGPLGFTRHIRALGDDVTRLDRYEPDLNFVPPGEIRDTTSPFAHAHLMQRLLVDSTALSEEHRALLLQWMIETETGLRRIRAGLPQGWRAGDKTGSGYREQMSNKTNDIAIAWPPGRAPVLITAYLETPHFGGVRDQDQAVLAEVGRIAAAAVAAD